MNLEKNIWKSGLFFALAMWLSSRFIIATVMFLITPLLSTPANGITPTLSWDNFSAWDSILYKKIAIFGYDYSIERKEYLVAFFPVFPFLIRVIMNFGLPFEVAGTLVNNLAFLGSLMVLYTWINERHGTIAARWVTAVLAWFPQSLFGTVIYSEGLYLLLTTAALQAFDKKQYVWTSVWGAMATATRPTGIALIPAFLLASWKEGRGIKAYLASLATSGGLLLYSLYCQIKFGDALAFIHAQKAWRPSLGFDWQGWWKMLMQITVGTANWKYGWIKDPLHPVLFCIICSSVYILWRFRQRLGVLVVGYSFGALALFLWLLAGDPLINMVTIFGGGYLLWHLRKQLTPITLMYGFCGLGLILLSGGTWSLSRIAYGIVSLSIALGMLFSRYPRWGYLTLSFFTILLASLTVRFAQKLWVG